MFMGRNMGGGIVCGNVSGRGFPEDPELVKVMSDENDEVQEILFISPLKPQLIVAYDN